MLPSYDQDFLNERHPGWSAGVNNGMICLVLQAFALPAGFTVSAADLLLRLQPGYPDIAPDMWWFSPAIVRNDARVIAATESIETYLGRTWQRWSRHLQPGQWRAGVDSIESYLSLVHRELSAAARPLAA